MTEVPVMNVLAKELNNVLDGTVVSSFLSSTGRRMYFPKGIVAQSAEAGEKAKKYNATVGLATKDGEPMHMSDIYDKFVPGTFRPKDIFNYAPGGGDKELRALWKDFMLKKNPSLAGKKFSDPLVCSGLTHVISIVSSLFVDPGDEIVCPDLFWDNYELIFSDLAGGVLVPFDFFTSDGHFNTEGMKKALLSCKGDSARIILNFPNNPTGYSPSKSEADDIVKALKEVAAEKKVLAILDDAYFGLFYEEETEKESLFAKLADADDNIFAIKGDAATKEDMVWGFRIGFISYASKCLDDKALDALTKKTLGAIRCTVSNCDRPGQSLLVKALKEGKSVNKDKETLFNEMKMRYNTFKEALEPYKESKVLKPYPFNSGYFMAFDTFGRSAEELRTYLLEKYQVGAINIMDRTFRVAYCSVENDKIKDLVALIYKAAEELWS